MHWCLLHESVTDYEAVISMYSYLCPSQCGSPGTQNSELRTQNAELRIVLLDHYSRST